MKRFIGHGEDMRFAVGCFVVVAASFLVACPTPVVQTDAGPEDAGPSGPVSCADDEQCSGGFCRGGLCVDFECRDKSECASDKVCVEGRCAAPPEKCTSPADCPGTLVCDGFSDSCFDPNEGEGEGGEGEGEGEEGEGEGEGEEGEGEGEGTIDLEGFRLENREGAQVTVLPSGISLDVGDVLVVGRDASQAEFTAFWGSFGAGAQYLNAETDNGVPVINGQEKFAIVAPGVAPGGPTVDGPSRVGASKKCYARTAPSAGADASWSEGEKADATPGVAAIGNVHGLVVTEWCDADGSGNFVFEFIEIANLP